MLYVSRKQSSPKNFIACIYLGYVRLPPGAGPARLATSDEVTGKKLTCFKGRERESSADGCDAWKQDDLWGLRTTGSRYSSRRLGASD